MLTFVLSAVQIVSCDDRVAGRPPFERTSGVVMNRNRNRARGYLMQEARVVSGQSIPLCCHHHHDDDVDVDDDHLT